MRSVSGKEFKYAPNCHQLVGSTSTAAREYLNSWAFTGIQSRLSTDASSFRSGNLPRISTQTTSFSENRQSYFGPYKVLFTHQIFVLQTPPILITDRFPFAPLLPSQPHQNPCLSQATTTATASNSFLLSSVPKFFPPLPPSQPDATPRMHTIQSITSSQSVPSLPPIPASRRPSTTREDVVPWEYHSVPPWVEAEAPPAVGGGRARGISTAGGPSTSGNIKHHLSSRPGYIRQSLNTGLVEDVTPWELFPAPEDEKLYHPGGQEAGSSIQQKSSRSSVSSANLRSNDHLWNIYFRCLYYHTFYICACLPVLCGEHTFARFLWRTTQLATSVSASRWPRPH